jgi:hypothetical protein
MNQPTHAWLAAEAYRKIALLSKTNEGKKKKLIGLERLLGAHLDDVVIAAWLPDALIKDMTYGHVFKNSTYKGDQRQRFTLSKKDLRNCLVSSNRTQEIAFDKLPDSWWEEPYRVKVNGGHLPARVNALCQTVRDMFRMGDDDVIELTGIKSKGAEPIAKEFRYSPRNIAMTLWMASHYIADSHMPFHCDNRALASTAKQKTHGEVEDIWGKQVSTLYHAKEILSQSSEEILAEKHPKGSEFASIDFGNEIAALKNNGDPWKEAVYICRASFAVSFAFVPPDVAGVDDQKKKVSLKDIFSKDVCGEKMFWNLSRAIMADAASAIATFWQDAWVDFTKNK